MNIHFMPVLLQILLIELNLPQEGSRGRPQGAQRLSEANLHFRPYSEGSQKRIKLKRCATEQTVIRHIQ